MKFEIGKKYSYKFKGNERVLKILSYEVGGTYVCSEYRAKGKEFMGPASFYEYSAIAEELKEYKEPRALETKTEWYATMNFDKIPRSNDFGDNICGGRMRFYSMDKCPQLKEIADVNYPSFVKIEITAKVTEIVED